MDDSTTEEIRSQFQLVSRSKLFQLNEMNEWIDKGIECNYQENEWYIMFFTEMNEEKIYEHKLTNELIIDRSEEKIINLDCNEKDEYMALSFVNLQGAQDLWNLIQEKIIYQRNSQKLKFENQQFINEEYRENILLTLPSLDNLNEFESEIQAIASQPFISQAQQLQNIFINKPSYLEKLIDIFNTAENSEKIKELEQLYRIFILILQNSEFNQLKILLSDQYYLSVFGILEYNTIGLKAINQYRNFLTNTAQFHQVLEIQDLQLVKIIHFIYRLQYLRDCVLAYFLTERSFEFFQEIITITYRNIFEQFFSKTEILDQLFEKLNELNLDAFKLLKELCNLTLTIEVNRYKFYDLLDFYNIYSILMKIITNSHSEIANNKINDEKHFELKILSLQILTINLQTYPYNFKQYLISEDEKNLNYPCLNNFSQQLIIYNLQNNNKKDEKLLFLVLQKKIFFFLLLFSNYQQKNGEILIQLVKKDLSEPDFFSKRFLKLFIELFITRILDQLCNSNQSIKLLNQSETIIQILKQIFHQSIDQNLKKSLIDNQIIEKIFNFFEQKSCSKVIQIEILEILYQLIILKDNEINEIILPYFLKLVQSLNINQLQKSNLKYSRIQNIFCMINREQIKFYIIELQSLIETLENEKLKLFLQRYITKSNKEESEENLEKISKKIKLNEQIQKEESI